ncbi:MAG TPA: FUSC family protein [Candidatus Binataceae bacterium]
MIGTLGAGLVAICHVNNELGTYIAWLLVGAGPMMSVRKAGKVLALLGLAAAASVVMARAFAETPWLMLPFLFALFSWSTYIGNVLKLGAGLMLIEVISVNIYYLVEFAPHEIGWFASEAVGGTVIALGVLILFDNWLWPERGETLLMESLGDSLGRVRSRLIRACAYYLGSEGAARPPLPPPTSDLPGHMALLNQAVEEGLDTRRHAILVAAVTRVARISLEVDRLTIAARERVPREIRGMLRTEIQSAADAIADALDEIAREFPTEIPVGVDLPPPPARLRAMRAMDALSARIIEVRPTYIARVSAREITNFAAFADALAAVTGFIERLLDEPPAIGTHAQPDDSSSRLARETDPGLLRYSLKAGFCIVVGYVVGIVSQRVELATILTTVVIIALPTYGAAFRKMVLRIVGAAIGGAISLLVIIIVSPNFDTLPVYLISVFAIFYVSAYSSLASGRIAYAGKQIGTTFALVFAGLSPSIDIYGPLWRIWAIMLGTFVVAAIAFVLWPEYAGDSLLPRLRRVIADTLALAPGGAASNRVDTIDRVNSETMRILAEMLEVADDAQVEGRTSMVDHNAIVEAAGTLRRIANRLASISTSRIVTPTPQLDPMSESAREFALEEIRHQLRVWLEFFGGPNCLKKDAARALARAQLSGRIDESLKVFEARLEENEFARVAPWTLDQRRVILVELNSLRRITVLLPNLTAWLAQIPGTT